MQQHSHRSDGARALLGLLVAAAAAFTAPRRRPVLAPRRGKGFGADAEKPKKIAVGRADDTVDEVVDDDAAARPGVRGRDLREVRHDSSGRARRRRRRCPSPSRRSRRSRTPDDVQVAAEKILLGGGLLCLAVFVFIGGAITVDAFSVASGSPLEPGMKAFIVDVLEPKFTPTLIAGFACSISLGGLKALQLTSDDAQYSEGVQYSEEDD